MGTSRRALPVYARSVGDLYTDPEDYFYTTISAATAINLPLSTHPWRLVKVDVLGGAGAGDFDLLLEGGWHAKFPTGNGIQTSWEVDYPYPGSSVPAAIQTFEGDANPASVGLHFAKKATPGAPPIVAYRSILVKDTEGGANANQKVLTAANFDISPAVPKAALWFTSAGNAQFFWTSLGGIQAGGQMILATQQGPFQLHGAPRLPSLGNVTPAITNSAAAHLTGYYFYDPTIDFAVRRVA